jgi:spermidine synthase
MVFVIIVIGLAVLGRGIVWSPYQRLDVIDLYLNRRTDGVPVRVGYTLRVQQVFHLVALDLSEGLLARLHGEIPMMEAAALTYNLPYHVRAHPNRVLVVGAGMGNDVAAALRAGAGHVDAVEIDPAIASLGQRLHPEHPFGDARVHLVIDDARSYLQRSPDRYDLIVFGYPDSRTLLLGLSSVRLDSYVYTVESLEQAREHLSESGVAVLSFAIGAPWIEQRLGRMLIEVFGADRVFVQEAGMGTTFVAGSLASAHVADIELSSWRPSAERIPLATDDWPYLYLRARTIPAAYWQLLLIIGLLSVALIVRSFPEALHPLWDFWLLGAAFLLIEFKSITELALLFGTTWFVNVLAISGVLVMALAANLLILALRRVNLQAMYILLLASLALAYFTPASLLVGLPIVARMLAGTALLSLPLLFAGLVFSESLRRTGEAVRPLSSNLSGCVLGGALEYGSLLTGVKSLYIFAAVVYLGAWVGARLQRR